MTLWGLWRYFLGAGWWFDTKWASKEFFFQWLSKSPINSTFRDRNFLNLPGHIFSLRPHLLSDTTGLFNILLMCGTSVRTAIAGEVRWCYMPTELHFIFIGILWVFCSDHCMRKSGLKIMYWWKMNEKLFLHMQIYQQDFFFFFGGHSCIILPLKKSCWIRHFWHFCNLIKLMP